jgi:hypothetical protein
MQHIGIDNKKAGYELKKMEIQIINYKVKFANIQNTAKRASKDSAEKGEVGASETKYRKGENEDDIIIIDQ